MVKSQHGKNWENGCFIRDKVPFKCIVVLWIMCLISANGFAHRKDVIIMDDSIRPVSEKEAILILPGFGSKMHGVKDIAAYFSHKGYDLYIPHYIGRDSLQQCVATLNDFIDKHNLLKYRKLHVFSYIAGSWVLNLWLQKHPNNNIASIVYDRSPLQERAPFALVKDNRLLIKLIAGNIMKEFSETPYPSIPNDHKNLGTIIENKPTKLIRKHKRSVLSLGPVRFEIDSLHQSFDDHLYDCINHDEMYYRFNKIGPEILFFFKNGRFTKEAKKEPDLYDVFDKRFCNCLAPGVAF